ncbi:MAG: hypothetical protein WCE21_03895 [Candidatus Babeliales bacterium]
MIQLIFFIVFCGTSVYGMDKHQHSHTGLTVNAYVTNASNRQSDSMISVYEGSNVSTRTLQPLIPNSNLSFNHSMNANSVSMGSSSIQSSDLSSSSNTHSYYQPSASHESYLTMNIDVRHIDSRQLQERMQIAKEDCVYNAIKANSQKSTQLEKKVATLTQEVRAVAGTIRLCAASHQAGSVQPLINVLEMTIHEPHMNHFLNEKKLELVNYITTSEGTLRRPTIEESDAINNIATSIETRLLYWLDQNHPTVAMEMKQPHSESYYQSMPYSERMYKYTHNNANKDLKTIHSLCAQGKLEEAALISEKHLIKGQASIVDNEARNMDGMARGLYRSHTTGKYDSYGVRCEYRQDPLYDKKTASLKRSETPVPNEELNNLFGKRYEAVNAMLNKLPPEALENRHVKGIAYTLVELHEKNPMLVPDYLTHVVACHGNASIREAGQFFFGQDGLPVFYTFDQTVSDLTHNISPNINTPSYAQEWELLDKLTLLHMQYPNEEAYAHGITYVVQASNGHPCAAEYLAYAQTLVETGSKVDQKVKADFLKCGSFYTPQVSEADGQLHKEVVTMATTLAQSVNNNEIVQGKSPTHMLHRLHIAYTDYFQNPRTPAKSRLSALMSHYDKYLTKQLPMQINMPSTRSLLSPAYSLTSVLVDSAAKATKVTQEFMETRMPTVVENIRMEMGPACAIHSYLDQMSDTCIDNINAIQDAIASSPASHIERGKKIIGWEVAKWLPRTIKNTIHPVDAAIGVAHGLEFLFRGYNYLKLTYDPLLMPVQYLCPPLYEWSYHAKLMTDDALLSFYNARRIEKLKTSVSILTDIVAVPLLHKGFNIASSGLRNSIIKLPPYAKNIPALAGIGELSEEVAVLGTMAESESEIVRTFGNKLKPTKGSSSHMSSLEKVVKELSHNPSGPLVQMELDHPVLSLPRTGSALKIDKYHAFDDIIDNYARFAKKFTKFDRDTIEKGVLKELYQIEGSLNDKPGIFEWIVDYRPEKGITHRLFIENGTITGKANVHVKTLK